MLFIAHPTTPSLSQIRGKYHAGAKPASRSQQLPAVRNRRKRQSTSSSSSIQHHTAENVLARSHSGVWSPRPAPQMTFAAATAMLVVLDCIEQGLSNTRHPPSIVPAAALWKVSHAPRWHVTSQPLSSTPDGKVQVGMHPPPLPTSVFNLILNLTSTFINLEAEHLRSCRPFHAHVTSQRHC